MLEPSGGLTQVFSHFRLELSTMCAVRSDAEFKDPRMVPLTTATRKALAAVRRPADCTVGSAQSHEILRLADAGIRP